MHLPRFSLLLALMMVWLLPICLFAQPSIHGSLSGTLGPGTYIVDGDCQVLNGNTLTIEPGTTFLFSGHFAIKVYGTINANGTESEPIEFLRQFPNETCRWGGLRFQPGAPGNSNLTYCLIDNCKNISYPNYYYGGGLWVSGVSLLVEHTTIQNCQASQGGGFYGTSNSNVRFVDCLIKGNTASNGGGLYYSSSGGQVVNCIVAKNSSTNT